MSVDVNRPDAAAARSALVILGICAVAIAACSAPRPQATAPEVTRPGVVTTTAPPALSPHAYQVALRGATSAMGPAFDRLSKAGSPEDARTELAQASTAASDAARLLAVNPPVEMLVAHHDLLSGLRQLADDLSQLSGQVAAMELCAVPSIRAAVSNASGVSSLRAIREDLGSGRLGASYEWGEFLPEPTPQLERRLANGRLIDSAQRTGRGQLKVDNGAGNDAVVKLVQGGRPIASVYVRAESSATVGQIKDGSYELFYTSGEDWDEQLKVFTRSCQFTRFEETAEFATTSIKGGIRYTVQTIGLQPRIDGNARTSPVPAESFPR